MKLGQERREGLGRDDTVARQKRSVSSRLALVSFRLTVKNQKFGNKSESANIKHASLRPKLVTSRE